MSFKQLDDGTLIDLAQANEEIIKQAPKQGHALKEMARFQIGMPTRVRMQLAACGVTIDVLYSHLMNAREAWKSFMTVVGLETIKGQTEFEAINRVAAMIMLSHECKLKLIELAKAVKEAKEKEGNEEMSNFAEHIPINLNVLIIVDELVKLLPPEVMEELNTKP